MMLETLTKLLEEWICDGMKDLTKNRIEPSNEYQSMDDRNRKIMSFVGFALSSTIKNYNKHESVVKISGKEEKQMEYCWVGTFLRRMRILHKDALENAHYTMACYSNTDKVLNHGGLALISPQFFDFAIALSAACDKEINEEKIHERGNKCFEIAKAKIMGDKDIREKFDTCSCLDKDEMTVVKKLHINAVYDSLLKKNCTF